MKKYSLSIHKSFLNKQTSPLFSKSIKVIKPGDKPQIVCKGPIPKTDRGRQFLALSGYKKCLKSTKIENNRLDLVLFYLKYSKSLSESKHLISQRNVKVNGHVITQINHKLRDYSIIECNNKNSLKNFVTHEISNTITIPPNVIRINDYLSIFYYTPDSNSQLLPKDLNIALMRRMA